MGINTAEERIKNASRNDAASDSVTILIFAV
jgi:hypothetical protein